VDIQGKSNGFQTRAEISNGKHLWIFRPRLLRESRNFAVVVQFASRDFLYDITLEAIMSISQMLLPEFDHEMARTRKTLERVPEDKFGWKPHEKSGTLGWLAGHVATLPNLAVKTIGTDQLDFSPPGGPAYQPPKIANRRELLEAFDKSSAEARAALAGASDEHLTKQWSLLMGGQTLFTMPRVAVLRSFVMNHLIHHRAQLTVYLRLLDVPVPALYGPSADEKL
jgi:uncharacterized damage-inducible protein DinB